MGRIWPLTVVLNAALQRTWHRYFQILPKCHLVSANPTMTRDFCDGQPAEACSAAGGTGDTRQGYLQEVLARGRGHWARARAAPSPAAQPLGYGTDSYAKAKIFAVPAVN